jgi:hypothetical protein
MHRLATAVIFLLSLPAFGAGCGSASGDESDAVEAAQQPIVGTQGAGAHVSTGNCSDCDPQFAWVYDLYATFDTGDVDTVGKKYLTSGASLRFANNPYVYGRANVVGFFESIWPLFHSVHHEVLSVWKHPGGITVKGEVTVVRVSDDVTVTVPFMSVWTAEHEKISEVLDYLDPTPMLE